jgi:hypothetical protein
VSFFLLYITSNPLKILRHDLCSVFCLNQKYEEILYMSAPCFGLETLRLYISLPPSDDFFSIFPFSALDQNIGETRPCFVICSSKTWSRRHYVLFFCLRMPYITFIRVAGLRHLKSIFSVSTLKAYPKYFRSWQHLSLFRQLTSAFFSAQNKMRRNHVSPADGAESIWTLSFLDTLLSISSSSDHFK